MVRTRSPLDLRPVVRFTSTDLYIGTRHETIFRLAWIASPTVVPPRGGTFDFVEPISDLPARLSGASVAEPGKAELPARTTPSTRLSRVAQALPRGDCVTTYLRSRTHEARG